MKLRLYPKPNQEKILLQTLEVTRNWYNMCIEERKLSWDLKHQNITRIMQQKIGISYRKTFPYAKIVSSYTMQNVCRDVDKSFQAFFRRVKAGEYPGYPRFKSYRHWHSFGYSVYGSGWKIDGRRLKLFGAGRVRIRWGKYIEGKPKSLRIVHHANHWYACIAYEIPDELPLPKTGKVIGIDVGISSMITLNDGHKIDNPEYYRSSQAKLRVLQRALSSKKKGSNNKNKALLRVQRCQEYVKNQRMDFLHKLTRSLINDYDLIAIEDLQIKNMVHNKHLSKSILDSGWGLFRQYLTYKAESAGRKIVAVNPAYTSKTCSNCGKEFNNFSLSTRWVKCSCGLSLDRDHNAAINILKKSGWDTSVLDNVECSEAHASNRILYI